MIKEKVVNLYFVLINNIMRNGNVIDKTFLKIFFW